MMTDIVDEVGGAASSIRLWRGRVGLAAMLSDHSGSYSSDNILDARDNDSLVFANIDTRKRKEVSSGGLDAVMISDQNKRNKHESSKYSCASFDTHSNLVEGLQVRGPLIIQTNCVVASSSSRYTSAEQFTSAEELVAAEVVTSFWSTDNDNTGDDQYSRGDSSTFSSSEESCSQRLLCRHLSLQANRNVSAFDQAQKQRDNSWTGESNLIQLQLGSFIHKEKLKLESEFEEGSSALSKHSLSGSISGVESEELVTGIPDDRLSGSSYSLSGFLGASSSFEESNEYTRYHSEMLHSSRTSSMLSSYVGNKKMNWFDLSNKDEVAEQPDSNMHIETEGQFCLTESIHGISRLPFISSRLEDMFRIGSSEVHQKFVLSSGRLSHGIVAREDTRLSTIDRDFDDYFAKLML